MLRPHVPFPAKRRDRHRRFTLAVDLHEALTHDGDGFADVSEIHRPTTIDDGANALTVLAAAFGGIDQPPNHGRRAEHHDIVELAREIEHFVRIEATGPRNDMPAAHSGMREIIKAGAVRNW